jgi:hypothetical protein
MGSAADVSSQPAPPNPEAHSQLPVALHAPRPLQPEGQITPLPPPLLDPEAPRNPVKAELELLERVVTAGRSGSSCSFGNATTMPLSVATCVRP